MESKLQYRALALGILSFAAALRVAGIWDLSLWYDELQAVTFADRPFPLSLASALAYDCHPPLYNLFLSAWGLLGTGDGTVLASSVLLSVATTAVLLRAVEDMWGQRPALVCASIFALHPLSIYWSQFARMYCLWMLMCVCCLWANHRYLNNGSHRRGRALWVVLAELGVVYSHIAGLYSLGFILAYLFVLHRQRSEVFARWIRLHILSGILCLPAVEFPLSRGQLGHMHQPGAYDVLAGLALFVGGPQLTHGLWLWLGALFYALAAALLLLDQDRAKRWFAVVFLLAPGLLAVLISHTLRPMWLARRTLAFLVPLVPLGLALLFFTTGGRRLHTLAAKLVTAAVVVLMALGTGAQLAEFEKREPYAEVAASIEANAEPGDLIVVASERVGWSLKWYLLGPDWDRSMAEEVYPAWAKTCRLANALPCLYDRIRDFDRQTRRHGFRVAVGEQRAHPDGEARIWTLARTAHNHRKLSKFIEKSSMELRSHKSFGGLTLAGFRRVGQGGKRN